MMQREQVSFLRLARISAQISPIGVRDMVLPPMPTEIAVVHERGRLLERNDLLAQAPVALRQVVAQLGVGVDHAHVAFLPPTLGIEILDQPIPGGNSVDQRLPKVLALAAIEIVDRDALLLDPGVVAEIENALAVDVAQLQHMIVGDAFHVPAENLARIDLVESVGIAPREIALAFAAVHRGAVGRDRHHDVIRTIVEMLGELDGGDDVRQT